MGESIELGAAMGKLEHLPSSFEVRGPDLIEGKVETDFCGAVNDHANLAL
ncbi:MAG: hypothetical protein NTV52_25335 [Acidobacteria bacterium]|nr:hypothetical protein [Acidobacteriota bacterium]